ncbi:hypothetical protein ACFWGN_20605 [Oerskovia sp. NPDC060338]|uniref:hypothetical protein n=1 Tax=Oerskovia sp. NPDC060338 TaxID=3347100 RepID=UPI003646E6B1
MTTKLREIEVLHDGWWGPESRAVDRGSLQIAERAMFRLADGPAHVSIAPLADGSLMLEWSNGDTECTAELLPGGEMTLTIDNPAFDIYVERQVAATAARLVEFYVTTAGVHDA